MLVVDAANILSYSTKLLKTYENCLGQILDVIYLETGGVSK